MGYRSMVEREIDKAFRAIGDLATTVTLVKKASSTFNFDTLNVKNIEMANLITTAVIENSDKRTTEHNTNAVSLLLKTKEVGDINLFESVIINSDTHKIGTEISTDGYLTNVEIFKEG